MSRSGKRRFFAVATFVTALVLGGVGFALGIMATTVPNVLQGGVNEHVRLWVDQPDTQVDFIWSVETSGEIVISITDVRNVETLSSFSPFVAYVVLTCDARLVAPELVGRDGVMDTLEFGSDDSCITETNISSDVATQVIPVPVNAGEYAWVRGWTVAPWSASGAGQRVTRTPWIMRGYDPTVLTVEELASLPLTIPGPGTTLSASLNASPTETLNIYAPEGDPDTDVTTSAALQNYGGRVPPGVAGSVSWTSAGPVPVVHAGFARWNDSAGTASAQLTLLLSGAFLGVAASVLIEFLFEAVKRPSLGDRGHKPTSSPDLEPSGPAAAGAVASSGARTDAAG